MKNYITTLFLICSLFGFAQKVTFTWQSPREQWSTEGSPIKALSFKESSIVSSTHKVGFQKLTGEGSVSAVSFSNVVYENLTSVEDSILKGVVVSSKIDYSLSQVKAREKTLSCVSIIFTKSQNFLTMPQVSPFKHSCWKTLRNSHNK